MTKLRTLILVLVLCGVAPTASADDFWTDSIPIPGNTAPLFGARTYGEPPCDDYSGFDDYTDLLLLDQLETMNQTLRDIESHMREALHQEAWDRMLGRYRN